MSMEKFSSIIENNVFNVQNHMNVDKFILYQKNSRKNCFCSGETYLKETSI